MKDREGLASGLKHKATRTTCRLVTSSGLQFTNRTSCSKQIPCKYAQVPNALGMKAELLPRSSHCRKSGWKRMVLENCSNSKFINTQLDNRQRASEPREGG